MMMVAPILLHWMLNMNEHIHTHSHASMLLMAAQDHFRWFDLLCESHWNCIILHSMNAKSIGCNFSPTKWNDVNELVLKLICKFQNRTIMNAARLVCIIVNFLNHRIMPWILMRLRAAIHIKMFGLYRKKEIISVNLEFCVHTQFTTGLGRHV